MEVRPVDKEEVAREKGIYRVTIVGSVVNFLLLLFKFFAGIAGHSAAMLADAVHSLSDFVTDIIVIVFVRISSKPEDEGHDYGHGKYETLATAIIGIVLLFVGFGIFWNGASSIYRFLHGGSLQEPGMLALIAALVSIAFKEALYRYTVFRGKKLNSRAVVANAWHHRSDAFSSVATLVGVTGAMFLGEKWRVLDPVAALVVAVFIAIVAFKMLGPALGELLGRSLPAEECHEIEKAVANTAGVKGWHALRTFKSGNDAYVEVHIKVDPDMTVRDAHHIATLAERHIKEVLPDMSVHPTTHIEPYGESCKPE